MSEQPYGTAGLNSPQRDINELRATLAAAEARVSELTKQLAIRCRAETCDKEELLAENVELRAKLAAAEAGHHCETCGELLIPAHERVCCCRQQRNTFVRNVGDD